MKKNCGLRKMADGGLIGAIKGLGGQRQKVLDAAEAAVGIRAPVPPSALAPAQKPITVEEAQAKAARFKFERENPGVPYVPPKKMASGGMITGRGGPTEDKELIRVSPGEFVLPADTVEKVGAKNLQRIVNDTHVKVPGANRGPDGLRRADDGYLKKLRDKAKNALNIGKKTVVGAVEGGTAAAEAALDYPDIEKPAAQRTAAPSSGVRGLERITPEGAPYTKIAPDPIPSSAGGPSTPPWREAAFRAEGAMQGGQMRPPGGIAPPVSGIRQFVTGLAKGAVKGGVIGESILHSSELGEPADDVTASRRAERGLQLSPTAAAMSDRERYAMLQEINSGDPQRAALARDKMVGTQPVPFAQPKYVPDITAQGAPGESTASYRSPVIPTPAVEQQQPDGQGIVSNGVRSLQVNAPGLPDTIRDANAAARAEMQAMDVRTQQANDREGLRLRGMANKGQLVAAKYEAEVAAQNAKRFPRDLGVVRDAALKNARYEGLLGREQKEFTQAQDHQVELAKNATFTDAMRNRDALGLRGTQYSADKKLEGDKVQAGATLSAANARAGQAAAQASQEQQNKLRTEGHEREKDAFTETTTDQATGKTSRQYNPEAHQEYKKWVVGYAANNPAFKKAHGGRDWEQISPDEKEAVLDTYKRRMALTANAQAKLDSGNDKPMGMPTKVSVDDMKKGDFINWRTDGSQNSISVGQVANGLLNPGTTNTAAEQVVTMRFPGGKAQRYVLSEIADDPDKMRTLIDMVSEHNPAAAKKLHERYVTGSK